MTGFLGTRADVFMDLVITFFVAAPFLMTYAIRLAPFTDPNGSWVPRRRMSTAD